jgi:hypothetical protein
VPFWPPQTPLGEKGNFLCAERACNASLTSERAAKGVHGRESLWWGWVGEEEQVEQLRRVEVEEVGAGEASEGRRLWLTPRLGRPGRGWANRGTPGKCAFATSLRLPPTAPNKHTTAKAV